MRRVFACGLVLLCALNARAESAVLARADALWDRRADGQIDAVARPEPIRAAIAAYEAALTAAPGDVELHWKLQRALWFCADFATQDPALERELYERALAATEPALALLPVADRSDAAHLYFWSAINLGGWSRLAGLLRAVRAGAAGRLHEAALRSIALDPGVEQGGAIRLLSRLHSELPRVPFLSAWVDHAQAVPLAERAVAEYPDHPGNPYLLGLALLDHAPERRAEALALLERTAALEPRSDHVVEDAAIRIAARERLEEERSVSR